jgi:predicted oxidoreductase (fatty acid repression mutant protein)
MSDLMSIKQWKLTEADENLHSGEAMSQYKTGVDNDVTLAAEGEDGIYDAYIERLEVRLDKHKTAYEDHLEGSVSTEEFIRDIELTKRLMEDFIAYQDRFTKLATAGPKKGAGPVGR